MICSDIEAKLSEYIDGEIDASARLQIEQHLLHCSRCKEKLTALKAVVRKMNALPAVEAPPDFLKTVHAKMTKPSPAKRLWDFLSVPFQIQMPLKLATALALGVIIFFLVQPDKQQQLMQRKSPEKHLTNKDQERFAEKTISDEIAKPKAADRIELAAPQEMPGIQLEKSAPPLSSPAPARQKLETAARAPELKKEVAGSAETKIKQRITIALFVGTPYSEKDAFAGMESELAEEAPLAEIYDRPDYSKKRMPATLSETRSFDAGKADSDSMKAAGEEPFQLREHTFLNINQIVNQLNGRVVSIEKNVKGSPESITIDLPADSYHQLIEQIGTIGEYQSPPPEITVEDNQPIQISIKLIPHP